MERWVEIDGPCRGPCGTRSLRRRDQMAEKAQEDKRYASDEEEKAKAEKRLKQYEQKKPWREE